MLTAIFLQDGGGREVRQVEVVEGDTVELVCLATGGHPEPEIVFEGVEGIQKGKQVWMYAMQCSRVKSSVYAVMLCVHCTLNAAVESVKCSEQLQYK